VTKSPTTEPHFEGSVHPSIHPSVYFADKYKQQINIKVHLQGEWKKRGD